MRLIILFFYYIIFNGINNKCKKTVVGKSKEKKQFLSGRRKWKDNIKMKLQDIGYQVVPCTDGRRRAHERIYKHFYKIVRV